ncbi:MAG: hypothetical protein ACKVGZ_07955, partial [Alphaproteobacteria bacterium]
NIELCRGLTYLDSSEVKKIAFDFIIQDPVSRIEISDGNPKAVGTLIKLSPYKSEYATHLPKKVAAVAN